MKMFKKITSAALAAAMMLTSGAAFAAFEDVDINATDNESLAINVVTGNVNFASGRSYYTVGADGQKLSVSLTDVAVPDLWKLIWGLDEATNSWPEAKATEKAFATVNVAPISNWSIMWGYDVPDQAGQVYAPDAYLNQKQVFLGNGHISHAEAAQIILNMIAADTGKDSALNVAVSRGIVDNGFAAAPNALLTNDEAIEMVVNALGYKGTPAGDDGLGILDGVVTGGDATTRTNLAVLIHNSMFVALGASFSVAGTPAVFAENVAQWVQDTYNVKVDINGDGVNDDLPVNVVLLQTVKGLDADDIETIESLLD